MISPHSEAECNLFIDDEKYEALSKVSGMRFDSKFESGLLNIIKAYLSGYTAYSKSARPSEVADNLNVIIKACRNLMDVVGPEYGGSTPFSPHRIGDLLFADKKIEEARGLRATLRIIDEKKEELSGLNVFYHGSKSEFDRQKLYFDVFDLIIIADKCMPSGPFKRDPDFDPCFDDFVASVHSLVKGENSRVKSNFFYAVLGFSCFIINDFFIYNSLFVPPVVKMFSLHFYVLMIEFIRGSNEYSSLYHKHIWKIYDEILKGEFEFEPGEEISHEMSECILFDISEKMKNRLRFSKRKAVNRAASEGDDCQ
jgi:hypothetical protein